MIADEYRPMSVRADKNYDAMSDSDRAFDARIVLEES